MKRYLIAMFFILVLGASCFIIPTALMKWQDEKRMDKIETVDAEVVKLNLQTHMSLAEKFELKSNSMASIIEVVNGKNYDQISIINRIKEELVKLNEISVVQYTGQDIVFTDIMLNMYVNPEDAGKSMLLWSVILYINGEELDILVDDENGKIISIEKWYSTDLYSYSYMQTERSFTESELEAIADKWGEYLGLEFISEKSGSADWVNEFMNLHIKNSDDYYIAVYGDGSDVVVYMIDRILHGSISQIRFIMYD